MRAAADFDYEMVMATMNRKLHAKLETVFLLTSPELFFVSSTIVKELVAHGVDISEYVPPEVVRALRARQKRAAR